MSSVFRDRVRECVKAETRDSQSLCDRKQSCDLLESPMSERTYFTANELVAQHDLTQKAKRCAHRTGRCRGHSGGRRAGEHVHQQGPGPKATHVQEGLVLCTSTQAQIHRCAHMCVYRASHNGKAL